MISYGIEKGEEGGDALKLKHTINCTKPHVMIVQYLLRVMGAKQQGGKDYQ